MDKTYTSLIEITKIHFYSNNFDKAIEVGEKAIELNSLYCEAYYWVGMSNYFRNELDEASGSLLTYIDMVRKLNMSSLQDNNQIFIAHYTMAIINSQQDDLDFTRFCLNTCIEIQNNLPKIPFHLMKESAKIWSGLIKEDEVFRVKNQDENILHKFGLDKILNESDDENFWKQVTYRYLIDNKDIISGTSDLFIRVIKIDNWQIDSQKGAKTLEKWIINLGENSKRDPILFDGTHYDKSHQTLVVNRPTKNERIAYVIWGNGEWKWFKDENDNWISNKDPDVEFWF